MRLGQFPFYISKSPHASLTLPVFVAVITNQNRATLGRVWGGMVGCWEAEKCLFCRCFSLKPDVPYNGGRKSVPVRLIWVIPDASLGSSDRWQHLLRAGCVMCCWPNGCEESAGVEERDGPFTVLLLVLSVKPWADISRACKQPRLCLGLGVPQPFEWGDENPWCLKINFGIYIYIERKTQFGN